MNKQNIGIINMSNTHAEASIIWELDGLRIMVLADDANNKEGGSNTRSLVKAELFVYFAENEPSNNLNHTIFGQDVVSATGENMARAFEYCTNLQEQMYDEGMEEAELFHRLSNQMVESLKTHAHEKNIPLSTICQSFRTFDVQGLNNLDKIFKDCGEARGDYFSSFSHEYAQLFASSISEDREVRTIYDKKRWQLEEHAMRQFVDLYKEF